MNNRTALKFLHILGAIFIISLFSCRDSAPNQKLKAQEGVLDLRGKDLSVYNLSGDWAYFHQKLHNPKDFEATTLQPDTFLYIPSIWNIYKLNGKPIPGHSFATYRLKILTDTKNPVLKVKGRPQSTSYKFWVGDSLLAQAGLPAASKENYTAKLKTFRKSFSVKDLGVQHQGYTEINLTLQIANYEHVNGGPWWTYQMGVPEQVDRIWQNSVFISLLAAGFILVMALYHFGLFFFQRKNFSYLFFGLLAFSLFFRVISTNERVLLFWFPEMSAAAILRIEYLSAFVNIYFLPAFFFTLYKEERHKIAHVLLGVFSLFIVVSISFFSIHTFSSLKNVYNIVLVLGGLYLLVYVMPLAIWHKRSGAWIAYSGLIAMIGTAAYDIAMATVAADGGKFISHYGLIYFILVQSYALAKRFSNAFNAVEQLSLELDFKNKNLEEIVEKRTEEIESQKIEILSKNEELLQQNEEIFAQKEAVEENREILEKRNVQVEKSIKYASTIQKAILPLHEEFSNRFNNFVIYRPKDIVSGDFYWTSFFHPDYVFFAVVDCTGHGVPGSFMSMIGSHMLREIVNERQIFEPSKILEELDREIVLTLKQETTMNNDGMDLALCRFERSKNGRRKVVYAGAKVPLYSYSKSDEKINRIKATRRSIGGMLKKQNKKDFKQIELEFAQGDYIYITTDGLIDQNNVDRSKLTSTGFIKLLDVIKTLPLEKQKDVVKDFIDDWQENTTQRDDITLVALEM
ncbi:MAG: SpoIIE family protein phosphatase [Bacteroidota bacterium]|nr:SpoIIE family protein phosphatase [Bacteroidota bacterium]